MIGFNDKYKHQSWYKTKENKAESLFKRQVFIISWKCNECLKFELISRKNKINKIELSFGCIAMHQFRLIIISKFCFSAFILPGTFIWNKNIETNDSVRTIFNLILSASLCVFQGKFLAVMKVIRNTRQHETYGSMFSGTWIQFYYWGQNNFSSKGA